MLTRTSHVPLSQRTEKDNNKAIEARGEVRTKVGIDPWMERNLLRSVTPVA